MSYYCSRSGSKTFDPYAYGDDDDDDDDGDDDNDDDPIVEKSCLFSVAASASARTPWDLNPWGRDLSRFRPIWAQNITLTMDAGVLTHA